MTCMTCWNMPEMQFKGFAYMAKEIDIFGLLTSCLFCFTCLWIWASEKRTRKWFEFNRQEFSVKEKEISRYYTGDIRTFTGATKLKNQEIKTQMSELNKAILKSGNKINTIKQQWNSQIAETNWKRRRKVQLFQDEMTKNDEHLKSQIEFLSIKEKPCWNFIQSKKKKKKLSMSFWIHNIENQKHTLKNNF